MKKILTMLFLVIFLTGSSFAQLISWPESFEGTPFPPTGWTVINGGDAANTWLQYSGAPHTGTLAAGIHWGSTAHEDYLIAPQLAPVAGNSNFSFWSRSTSSFYVEHFAVKLSTTGTAATDFTVTLAADVASPFAYTQFTYDLSAYNGTQVYVAIVAISTDQLYLMVDDVDGCLAWQAPNLATNPSPVSGSTDVSNSLTLTWSGPTTGYVAAGYKIYVGVDPTGVAWSIANGTDIGNVLNYAPAGLGTSTTYYWKVVPYNAGGDAVGAPIWSFTTFAGFGSLEGIVANCYGVPISGAQVAIAGAPGTYAAATDITGKYQFVGVPAATYSLTAQKAGYNTMAPIVVVIPASTLVNQPVITLTQPGMTVLPNPNNASVSPNEMLNNAFTVTNPGCGPLTWSAAIAYGSSNHSWFTMPTTTGTVALSANVSVPALFNASGLAVGTVLSATVTFTSTPDVGTLVVPVNMVVAGAALVPVTNLTGTLVDQIAGNVDLAWECTPGAGFLYYTVSRDGVQLAIVPSATTFSDVLPSFGVYTYEVSAWYADGQTAPASVVVEWPNPSMTWTPAALAANLWSGYEALVDLTIGNVGEGTLAFVFPDYAPGGNYLPYCNATATACDEFLGNVTIGSINNSTACNGYSNYTSLSTDIIIGQAAAITAANGGNAYSSDKVYVWIDYDHSGSFTAGELTTLTTVGGGASFTGNINVPVTALPGPTTMRVRMSYVLAANPCNSQTYGEVEDYAVNLKVASFITAVAPINGFVAPDADQLVKATFSATGAYAPVGVYVSQLVLHSNDLANASVSIPATMTVTVPGSIAGVVTDGFTGDVLPGVMVSATSGIATFTAMTDDNGAYSLLADAGTYTVTFSRTGYQTVIAAGAVVAANAVTTLNAQLFEEPYAPSCASASVNATDTQSTVTWCVPAGPYELLYDDGSAENFAAWAAAGNMNAVKFTPKGYPAHVLGAKLFVGDGSFPEGSVIDGAPFDVAVYDVDANGLPGTMLGSVAATVTNLGWVNVSGLDVTINSGDFFIVMVQGSPEPNCAPIGVDQSLPKAYKSYSFNVTGGGNWVLSPYQDFMIHAIVASPLSGDDDAVAGRTVVPGKVAGMISQSAPFGGAGVEMAATVTAPEGYDNTDMVSRYSLSRIFLGAVTPVAPSAGDFTLLNNNLTATTYTEAGTVWSNLEQGWYAYGVKAVYPNAQESAFVYTNNVPHKLFADVTVNVKLVCGFVPAEGAFVTLTGADYPNDVLTATVPASGTVVFDNVIKGNYQVSITYSGYTEWIANFVINSDKVIDAVLEDIRYMPRNLFVDDRTLVATWEAPLLVVLDEKFEAASFPPAGWEATSNGRGWFGTTNGSSFFFGIPAHTKYACANDDEADYDASMDYLITPELNLTNAPSFTLDFQSFYTGIWGGSAYVEMSTDAGASWTPVDGGTISPASSWQQVSIDLSAYSGEAGLSSVWFAFHYDDNGIWADGWAVDDVTVASGKDPEMGYGVFLDGGVVASPVMETTFTFNPTTINYGQTYVAGVAGLYCSGYSDLETYTFTAHFLYPPRNLEAVANNSETTGAAILTWEPPLSGDAAVNGATTADYSWMQSSGTLSNSGNVNNATPSLGFTATDAAAAEVEIKYCGDNNDAIGTGGAGDFIAAVRFTTDELYSYYDLYQITKAKIWLASSGTWSNVTFKVWEGGSYGDPGTEVYSEDVTAQIVADDYTTVTLTTPVPLAADKEYWIGYAVTATSGWMMGCDAGPYVDAKGAWLYFQGEWAELPDLGALPFNWNIIGIIDEAGTTPGGNLLSYNLYRNEALVASIAKTETTYWDMNLEPDTYCYDITAVYDLTPYGQAGQIGESLPEGTPCVDVVFGYPLPFVEDFTSGTLTLNKWTTTGVNWIVDGQAGNPLPSAKFKWDPLLTDYTDESLESFYLNGASINSTTPYKIWFDFDLKLDDRTASTNEKLTVEVWNGSSWSAVQEFANNGDFDWTLQHIDISAKAKHNVFKVRLRANGALSGDIYSWSVDNVNVYVEWIFNPALNFVVTAAASTPTNNDIKLTWEAPEGGIAPGTWIHYDDGVNSDGIGYNGPGDFTVAMLFEPSQLGDYDGMAVKRVKFFPREAACEYSIRVFVGTDLVVYQVVAAPAISEWNEVELTTPAIIDASQNLYIGYRNNTTTGFPAGCDAGPADAGLGDLLSEDNGATWVSIANEYGLDYNWNIQAFVEAVGDGMVALQPLHPAQPAANNGTLAVDPSNTETEANLAQRTVTYNSDNDNSDAMLGYNVYRRAYAVFPAGQNTDAAGEWDSIATVSETTYLDNDLSNLTTNCYEYHVKAVYTEGLSLMSNVDWECIFVGLNPNESNEVKVYPNPATTYVRIDLTKAVTEISVYNSLGSVVTSKNVKGETTITLNTNNYAAGAYSVKFTTENGETFSRKFVVTK
jgi:hypothetical protein